MVIAWCRAADAAGGKAAAARTLTLPRLAATAREHQLREISGVRGGKRRSNTSAIPTPGCGTVDPPQV